MRNYSVSDLIFQRDFEACKKVSATAGLLSKKRPPADKNAKHSILHSELNKRELFASGEHQLLIQRQQDYLFRRLYEIKRQRPPSTTVSDSGSIGRATTSCFSSMIELDHSIPCENSFLGESCQGSPQRCADLTLCDIDLHSVLLRHCTSSKSTIPSIDSSNISPRVSEFDLSTQGSCRRVASHCLLCGHGHALRRGRRRVVTFREPESEVMSSTEESQCECEPCNSCRARSGSESDKAETVQSVATV